MKTTESASSVPSRSDLGNQSRFFSFLQIAKPKPRKVQPRQPVRGRGHESTQVNQPILTLGAQPVEVYSVLLLQAARGLGLLPSTG